MPWIPTAFEVADPTKDYETAPVCVYPNVTPLHDSRPNVTIF